MLISGTYLLSRRKLMGGIIISLIYMLCFYESDFISSSFVFIRITQDYWFAVLILKILQARLQQYVNWELLVQVGFRKGRETRDQVNIHWITEDAREFQKKTSTSASLTIWKLLTVWITTNWGKFLKRWEYQTTLLAFWKTCMQVKKQYLELDMEQRTGSKLGKEYIKAVYCYPVYLTFM